MVDTPKENDDKEWKDVAKDHSLKKQSKRRRKRRSKSYFGRNNDHMDPAIEQGEPSPDQGNTGNQTEQPDSVEDNSPDDITPNKRQEKHNAHQRLVATVRSLKNRSKGSRLHKTHSESDGVKYSTLQRSTTVIATPTATQSESCYLNSMRRP